MHTDTEAPLSRRRNLVPRLILTDVLAYRLGEDLTGILWISPMNFKLLELCKIVSTDVSMQSHGMSSRLPLTVFSQALVMALDPE